MFETVWSGRTTRSRASAPNASHAAVAATVSVHWVRGGKSPSHSSARAMARAGSSPADLVPLGEEHGPLDGVVELAHVARPRVPQQRFHRVGGEGGGALAVAARVAEQEVRGEGRDVLAPLAQWRQAHLHGVEAEQQ